MEERFCLLFLLLGIITEARGLLYPQNSPTREAKLLDGPWNFRLSPKGLPNLGFTERWFDCKARTGKGFNEKSEVFLMPVPSSFNDITTSAELRDFVGVSWYQRQFIVPTEWLKNTDRASPQTRKVVVRFGGVHYNAVVWVNGAKMIEHEGGHLPFEVDVSDVLDGSKNCLTVAVNNTLFNHSIPQGEIFRPNNTDLYPADYVVNKYTFDFFNYAGIHRPVHIISLPLIGVEDISVSTTRLSRRGSDSGQVTLKYEVLLTEPSWTTASKCIVTMLDADGIVKASAELDIFQQKQCKGTIQLAEAKLWWPSGSRPDPGYRHTFQVQIFVAHELFDYYKLPFGIRTVTWDNNEIYINSEPFYLKGLGRHEDFDIRGKGFDLPLAIKDHNLMKWLGLNGYRTSHYPYAEEILDLSDQYGFVVISESPAVNLVNFDDELLAKHKLVMAELIARDKNRACVIAWSLSNEARSFQPAAGKYYKELVAFAKNLDTERPVTMVTNVKFGQDQGAQYMDILALNRYFSWYSDTGSLQLIKQQMINEVSQWREEYHKPLLISEYGADCVAGYHSDPPVIWTEEYQSELLKLNFEAFDQLRQSGNLVGEMVWNFADFQTAQGYKRANGNKKGLFTRDRKPKSAAHVLRERYNSLL